MAEVLLPTFGEGYSDDTLCLVKVNEEVTVPISLAQMFMSFHYACAMEEARRCAALQEKTPELIGHLPPLIPLPCDQWWIDVGKMYPQVFKKIAESTHFEFVLRKSHEGDGNFYFFVPLTQSNGFDCPWETSLKCEPQGITLELLEKILQAALRMEVVPKITTQEGKDWFEEAKKFKEPPHPQGSMLC